MGQQILNFLSMTGVWVGGLALAAFLVLYWTLRGAPIGQAVEEEDQPDQAPRASYRDRVVAASVFGLVLVAIAAYIAVAVSIPWSLPLFIAGFGLMIVLASINRRYRHASPILRRVVQFSNLALSSCLMAGVLIVGNVLAFKYGGRPVDFTGEGEFSLAGQTRQILRQLDRPVTFTAFMGNRETRVRVMELLQLYKHENPSKVEIKDLNPFLDPEQFEQLRGRAPEAAVVLEQGGGILVEYGLGKGAERVVVPGQELFELGGGPQARQNPARREYQFKGEDAITSAIMRLKEGKKPTIAIITGHGEPQVEAMDPNRPGLGVFRSRLVAMGANVAEINLVYRDVPEDAALVVIVEPQTPFQPEEVGKIRTYMGKGGKALVIMGGVTTGLEPWLADYKIQLGLHRIVEPRMSVRGKPYMLIEVLTAVRQPIVEPLLRRVVFLPNAVPITILPGTGGSSAIGAIPIVRTTRESWEETDDSGRVERDPKTEKLGPLDVGVAVTVASTATTASGHRDNVPRLVVFSSPEMVENSWATRNSTNLDLVMNSIHWLRGKTELIGIAPKTHVATMLLADQQTVARLVIVPTLMAFFLIIGFGLTAYISRRV